MREALPNGNGYVILHQHTYGDILSGKYPLRGRCGHFPLYGIFHQENTPYGSVCVSHFVQTDFLGTSKRVCVLSSQNDPLPRIMNRILSLTGERVCYVIQIDLLYDISSGKYPLKGLFMLF